MSGPLARTPIRASTRSAFQDSLAAAGRARAIGKDDEAAEHEARAKAHHDKMEG
jgi:hypothetical protein